MDVQYLAPLRRGWARMRSTLFEPFDLRNWLVIAFSAWLARLAGGGGGGGSRFNLGARRAELPHPRRWLREAWEQLRAHPHWLAIAAVVAAVALVVALVLVWVSSRGKFVFLDNVVHERARIAEPWRRLARLGDSLFLWRLGFLLVCLLAFATLAAVAVTAAGGLAGFGFANARATTITLLAVLLAALGAVACVYVSLFVDSFVVPVMYRADVGAIEAWRRLAPWIERYFGVFLLYGAFVLGLVVAVGACVIAVGLMTCCVGLVLVALPYVGTAILLPLLVTYRAFSLEFLAQLGPDFAVFPSPAPPPPSPAPSPST